jgi:hypothetical protein
MASQDAPRGRHEILKWDIEKRRKRIEQRKQTIREYEENIRREQARIITELEELNILSQELFTVPAGLSDRKEVPPPQKAEVVDFILLPQSGDFVDLVRDIAIQLVAK